MKRKLIYASLTFALAFLVVACTLEAPTEKQTILKYGNANFTSYVALGNSLTAGYQSGALTQKHQEKSYVALIAKQAKVTTFVQPLLGYPGIGSYTTQGAGIIELLALSGPTGSPVLQPAAYANYPNFNPANPYASDAIRTHDKPYNNLGVPGAVTYDVLNATSSTNCAAGLAGGSNAFFDIILRNPGFGNTTPFQQAQLLQPTFVTCWIGNNDVLGYATSGGTSPAAPTADLTFAALYSLLIDSLDALDAQVVVANIPDVTAIPFFTTIPTKVEVTGVGAVDLVIATNAGVRQAAAGDLILLPASKVIGDTTGAYGPQGVPVGLNAAAPLPNSLVLDAAEVTIAQTAVGAFNTTIDQLAGAKNISVVDINAIFKDIKANGYSVGGQEFSADFISGGIFSLDGVHPSDIGHAMLANEFIGVINSTYNSSIPLVNIIDYSSSIVKINVFEAEMPTPEEFKATIRAMGGLVD